MRCLRPDAHVLRSWRDAFAERVVRDGARTVISERAQCGALLVGREAGVQRLPHLRQLLLLAHRRVLIAAGDLRPRALHVTRRQRLAVIMAMLRRGARGRGRTRPAAKLYIGFPRCRFGMVARRWRGGVDLSSPVFLPPPIGDPSEVHLRLIILPFSPLFVTPPRWRLV